MYIAYRCLICKMTFIIPTEDVEKIKKTGRYIACNVGHRKFKELGKYDDIKECMDKHVYKRTRGSIKQIRWLDDNTI